MSVTGASIGQIVVPRGQPSSTLTLTPVGSPSQVVVEAQLSGLSEDRDATEALCTSYSYVVGDQGGNVINAAEIGTIITGLTVANFTVTVAGGGWAEAVVKLTSFA
jgi:hypothetical protein